MSELSKEQTAAEINRKRDGKIERQEEKRKDEIETEIDRKKERKKERKRDGVDICQNCLKR